MPGNVIAMRRRSEASPVPALPEAVAAIARGGVDLLSEDDLAADWAIDGVAEKSDTILLSGEEKVAQKTMIAIDLAIARVLGAQWLGFPVRPTRSLILVITSESGWAQCKRRVRQLCAGRGIAVERVAPFLHFVAEDQITMVPAEEIQRLALEAKARQSEALARAKDDKERAERTRQFGEAFEARLAGAGSNLPALEAILAAPPGTFGLIVLDTVTTSIAGDESNSADARRYTRAVRELARACGCPVMSIHHTSKHGAPGTARSSRGSSELTAGHRVLLTVDTSNDDHRVLSFRMNGHAAPDPIGYRAVPVVQDGRAWQELTADERSLVPIRVERCEPHPKGPSGKSSGLDDEEVLAVLRQHAGDALTVSKIRSFVSERRGGKPGSKFRADAVQGALDRLAASGLAAKVQIERKGGPSFDGWRLGSDSSPDAAKRIRETDEPHDEVF